MRKIEAVILDWAGTTVDFGCMAPVQAFVDAFRKAGILPTLEEVRKPMGLRKRDHVVAMLSQPRLQKLWLEKHDREWTQEDVDAIYEQSEAGILNIVHEFSAPKPYVVETAAALRERGIKIGSTTGYTSQMMEIVTAKAKEAGYEADTWFTPDLVSNLGRPYPYMIFKNMEALRVSSVMTVLKLGDTVADIQEGKNAGILSVGVVEGSSVMGLSEEEFNRLTGEERKKACARAAKVYWEAGADYVIANIKGLPPLIDAIERHNKGK